jgi:arginine exporter protein ArgO
MFAGVFAGSGLGAARNDAIATLLVTGVFFGSALWWFLLSFGASLFRAKITGSNLRYLNQVSGLILLVFGVIALHSSG